MEKNTALILLSPEEKQMNSLSATNQELLQEVRFLKDKIKEFEQSETEHKETIRKYQSRLETIDDWIWEVDTDGCYRYSNKKVKGLLGYGPEDIIGKKPFYLMPEEEARRVAAYFEKCAKSRQPFSKLENINIHKDGHEIVLETNAVPIYDAQGIFAGYRGIDRDITERRRTEEALHESEEKYRILVEKANDAIAIVQGGVFIFVNPKVSALLGIPPKELEGRPFTEFVFPEDRESVTINYEKRIAGETVHNAYDFRLIGAGGSVCWMLLSATTIRWKEKPATLYLMSDITDRKRTEEEREKLIVELREALSKVKVLSGLLPICASCKKIRNDTGYWEQMEVYIRDHSEADFSHSICPECVEKLYPGLNAWK